MDSINQIWPKWHTVELIGRGAFGEVYKVKREELGETFYSAVKVIRIPHDTEEIKELMDEGYTSQSIRYYYESIAKGLMNEIKVLEILKSAGNVVNIEEFEVHERRDSVGWDAYIRMELLKNLNEYRRGHKMEVRETAKMGMDICHALVCCEQSRIIHRDIKPSNIFVDAYGNFKLGDFGIARQMEKTRSTLSQKGTEMYMAPEVRFGDGQSSYNVDIYSLGLVMYRLLNKYRMPFEPLDAELISYQDKETALTRRLRGEELPLPAEAPEALGRIVLKACDADKDKRYQSTSQMYAELDRWIRGGAAEHKRGQRQSTQSRREDKAPEKPQKTDGAKKEKKEVFRAENESSAGCRPADEGTVLGFDTGEDQAETEKRRKPDSAGQQQVPPPEQETPPQEIPEPVCGEDVAIRQYIDEKKAEKGGKRRKEHHYCRKWEADGSRSPAKLERRDEAMPERMREAGKERRRAGRHLPGAADPQAEERKREEKNRDTKEKTEKKGYVGKQGVKNIWRNKMFFLASIATMSACIFLFGLFFSILVNFQYIIRTAEEGVAITVFFDEDATDAQKKKIGEELENHEGVSEVVYVSADEALEEFQKQYFGDNPELAEGFKDDNPLANSDNYEVYMKTMDDNQSLLARSRSLSATQKELVEFAQKLDGVREVNCSDVVANTLSNVNTLVAVMPIAIIILLFGVSIFLISNTVTMGIIVRKEEIAIMKYIGAKDFVVRSPFVIEGLIIGIFGAAIPLVLLYFLYDKAVQYIMEKFSIQQNIIDFLPVGTVYQILLPIGLVMGIGIGFLGSFFTVRKHLKV